MVGILRKRVTDSGKPEMCLMYQDILIVERKQSLNSTGFRQLFSLLYRFRRRIELNFADLLPEPQTSLLFGVLFGCAWAYA